jgi:predicted nucleic acid-binding protein
MARSVFVDTSGWYALIDRNDTLHQLALSSLQALIDKRIHLTTSDYVVDETCTLAKVRAGALAATRLLDMLHQTTLLRWEWIGAERFARAESLFRKHNDQGWSFTDCASFALMRELRIDRALTSDNHFIAAGFEALLSPKRR